MTQVSVSMHCDDYGVARGLPSNPRASQMAKSLGLNVDVKGDVFVSRWVGGGMFVCAFVLAPVRVRVL